MTCDDATPIPGVPGKTPDLAARLELSRLVMRHALGVALASLALSLALGLAVARQDTRDEIAGALALAQAAQRLQALPADDAEALAALRALAPPRHVRLRVADDAGRVLVDSDPAPPSPLLGWLMRADLREDGAAAQSVTWRLARGAGRAWTASVAPSAVSEQREALANLAGLALVLSACCLGMLAAMHWNVRRALAPLQSLIVVLARVGRGEHGAARALPAMPVRELAAIGDAVRRLAASLEAAEDARRVLAHKVLTLQEDERQRLARDLHDEFGQRLTALRADAAWLARRCARDAALAEVVAGMGEQIAHIQQDVRGLLARLQPLGPGADEADASAAHLGALLEALAASWNRGADAALRCEARLVLDGALRSASPADVALPRELVLAVYRISQEALTNAARHAGAAAARVEVVLVGDADGLALRWTARDDGRGLQSPEAALQRGNGLAGIRERVWALGGEFDWTPAGEAPMRGLHLRARLRGPARARALALAA